jgi:hypothetical protein
MRGAVVQDGVRRQPEAEDIVKTVRGIKLKSGVGQARTNAMGAGNEKVDGLSGSGQLWIGLAEVVGIPKVYAGLIAQFDRGRAVKTTCGLGDLVVFGLVAAVFVEIEKVDILDAIHVAAAGKVVPDRVVNRT